MLRDKTKKYELKKMKKKKKVNQDKPHKLGLISKTRNP
jgi:hypothetical protein